MKKKRAPRLPEHLMQEVIKVPRWKRNPYRALLQACFPAAFAGFGNKRKHPLKLQIYNDIRDRMPELSGKQVNAGLADYTNGPTYHRACTAGATRVDLEGHPAGYVLPHEAEYHKRALEALQERFDREAMQQADADYKGADMDAAEGGEANANLHGQGLPPDTH